MSSRRLENISETAIWVGEYRAMETRRPDALFRDPFAARLVGERGPEIVRTMKVANFSWPMVVRTAVMDEIILRAVEREGVDCVLNLAAGLDARPYRLPLPKSLRWIEADLPAMIAFKEEKLRGDEPVCQLSRVPTDLTDSAARRRVIAAAAEGSRRVLVVTEGLIVYLTEEQVAELARDLRVPEAVGLWLTDLASPPLLKMLQRRYGKHLDAANAPFRFGPAAGTKFFEPHGWTEREFRSTFEEGHRLNRQPPLAGLWRFLIRLRSPEVRAKFRRMAGIVLFERTGTP